MTCEVPAQSVTQRDPISIGANADTVISGAFTSPPEPGLLVFIANWNLSTSLFPYFQITPAVFATPASP